MKRVDLGERRDEEVVYEGGGFGDLVLTVGIFKRLCDFGSLGWVVESLCLCF